LLPSTGLSNEAGMNRDCCGSESCQNMKIHVGLFFNELRREFSHKFKKKKKKKERKEKKERNSP